MIKTRNRYTHTPSLDCVRIMVCGPIGGRGISTIKKMSDYLAKNGFETLNQFDSNAMNYSHIRDFRARKKLSGRIVAHDLKMILESDVIVVLPIPSFGAAIEMFLASELGKKIILFSEGLMPSPWPVTFADFVVRDKNSLVQTLKRIKKQTK